jgi:glycosyltransferase involved in cell wall biosynthesis
MFRINIIYKLYNLVFSKLNTVKYYVKEKILYFFYKRKFAELIIKKNPMVSIICPTYNRCDLLIERAVKSVLNQTYVNFEFLVISDGSTDNTAAEIKKINDPRIIFFEIKKKKKYPETVENHWSCGPVNAINYGLKKMNGDWICRIDDDDIWTHDHIEILLNFALKNKLEFVSSSLVEVRLGEKKINNSINEIPRIGGVQTWLYAGYLKFFESNINCWRKNWNKTNDTDVQDRFVKTKIKMGFLDYPTVLIMPRPGDDDIGIKAYKNRETFYKEHFRFK